MKQVKLHVCTLSALLAALGGFAPVSEYPSLGMVRDQRRQRICALAAQGLRYRVVAQQVNDEFEGRLDPIGEKTIAHVIMMARRRAAA